MIGLHYKRRSTVVSSSGADGKTCHAPFDAIDPGSNPPFAKLIFLPSQISNHIRKAFIFYKNEGNNQKVENKVSGMG